MISIFECVLLTFFWNRVLLYCLTWNCLEFYIFHNFHLFILRAFARSLTFSWKTSPRTGILFDPVAINHLKAALLKSFYFPSFIFSLFKLIRPWKGGDYLFLISLVETIQICIFVIYLTFQQQQQILVDQFESLVILLLLFFCSASLLACFRSFFINDCCGVYSCIPVLKTSDLSS